jgi:hypothetical protein
MPEGGRFIALTASAILLSIVSLVPLSSRAEEPGRPKATGYPDVEDVPPRPEKPAMTAEELAKLKKDLSATRDRHAPDAKAKAHPAPPVRPAKPDGKPACASQPCTSSDRPVYIKPANPGLTSVLPLWAQAAQETRRQLRRRPLKRAPFSTGLPPPSGRCSCFPDQIPSLNQFAYPGIEVSYRIGDA